MGAAGPSRLLGQGPAKASFCAPGLHTNVSSEVQALQAKQAQQMQHVDAAALGAGADTVRRDRHGRKLEMLTEMERQKEPGAKAPPPPPTWGRGLVQQKSKTEQREHARAWGAKPLAQYEDNAERDASKRVVQRWGDPMLGRTDGDKARAASGKPKYVGPPAPPNRFNLPPGHEWDGVDRSNGYEKQFFAALGKARSQADEAHAWSVADM